MMLKVAGGGMIRRGGEDNNGVGGGGGSQFGTCFGVHHHHRQQQLLQQQYHNHTTVSGNCSSDDGGSPPLLPPHHDGAGAFLYKYHTLLSNEPDVMNRMAYGGDDDDDDELGILSQRFHDFNIRDQIRTGFVSDGFVHGGGGGGDRYHHYNDYGANSYGDFNNGGSKSNTHQVGFGGYHQNGVYDSMRVGRNQNQNQLMTDNLNGGQEVGYWSNPEQSRIDAYKRVMLTEWARRGGSSTSTIPADTHNDAARRCFQLPTPESNFNHISRKKTSSIKDTLSHATSAPFLAGDNNNNNSTNCSSCQVQGHVYLMAKDQNGCRFLQRVFDEGSSKEVGMIFEELVEHVVELSLNQFGNYVIQKMLDVCDEEQRLQIVYVLTREAGQLVKISLNTYGTRVIQKLVETLKTRQQISLVVLALKPGLRDVVEDQNGNHVVQSCLKYLSNDDNKFIFDAAAKFCVDIGTHQHGCCVMQKCIDHFKGKYLDKLVTEISKHAVLLSQDPFGNYVIQHVIEQEKAGMNAKLLPQLEGNFVHLSMQKCSSNVVERCIKHCEESRAHIIHELLSVPHFDQLLQDPFANYVIQTALIFTKGPLHSLLVDAIRPHSRLRTSPYCKRIFSRNMLKK
ncbi:Putative pumilio homolog 7, chloroplastic [Linum grandiflorum]